MKSIKVRVKKINKDAAVPFYATPSSAGADLRSVDDMVIPSHGSVSIHTGLAFAPESDDYAIFLYARSGLACKWGCGLANGVGVIDYDYRGELIVCLYNHSAQNFNIYAGDRVAQMVIQPVVRGEFEEVDELEETVRGEGGFGSTGRK